MSLSSQSHVICFLLIFLFCYTTYVADKTISEWSRYKWRPGMTAARSVNHLWHLSNSNSSESRQRQYDLGRWQEEKNNMTPAILSLHWYPSCWSKYWRLCPLAPHHPRQQQVQGSCCTLDERLSFLEGSRRQHILSYCPHWKWSWDPLPCAQT